MVITGDDGGQDPLIGADAFPGEAARNQVPDEWGDGQPNAKGIGQRWADPENQGNGIRIDQGIPDSPFPCQQVDHVVVRSGGRIL
jgi:hypothetical protein